jgi:N-hydroxyarylamine O-acetyltransferase
VGGLTVVDIEAYMTRIGYRGARAATAATLTALHTAHVGAIPFENIDVRLGRPIRLDHAALMAKLVRARRGGYCFEHNTLFAAVLRALGYAVRTLEARVRPLGATALLPRTHMALRVGVDGEDLLADVGFGGDGLLGPAPLDGREVEQFGGMVRVAREGRLHVLQRRSADGWRDLYAFTLDEAFPIDYVMANHFTSTWPESPFVHTLTVQIARPGERRTLHNRTYAVRRDGGESVRELADDEFLPVLRDDFGLELPDGTPLPLPQ